MRDRARARRERIRARGARQRLRRARARQWRRRRWRRDMARTHLRAAAAARARRRREDVAHRSPRVAAADHRRERATLVRRLGRGTGQRCRTRARIALSRAQLGADHSAQAQARARSGLAASSARLPDGTRCGARRLCRHARECAVARRHSAAALSARRTEPFDAQARGSVSRAARRGRARALAQARHDCGGSWRRARRLDVAARAPLDTHDRDRQWTDGCGADGIGPRRAPARRRLSLSAAARGRLAGLRHGRAATAHRRARCALARAGLVPARDLQSEAADEEALRRSAALSFDRARRAGRERARSSGEAALSRSRRNHGVRRGPPCQAHIATRFDLCCARAGGECRRSTLPSAGNAAAEGRPGINLPEVPSSAPAQRPC